MSDYTKIMRDAAERAIRYRESLDRRRVGPSPEAMAATADFDEALSVKGHDEAETLAKLDQIGSPASVAMAGPRFFGFVIGGSMPVTVAANWLATAWDQNSVMSEVTPAVATLENVAKRWLCELFGLPRGSAASFVTGATIANFTALAAARHKVLADVGWDVERGGLIVEYLETIPEAGTSLKLGEHPVEILQIAENTVRTARIWPALAD